MKIHTVGWAVSSESVVLHIIVMWSTMSLIHSSSSFMGDMIHSYWRRPSVLKIWERRVCESVMDKFQCPYSDSPRHGEIPFWFHFPTICQLPASLYCVQSCITCCTVLCSVRRNLYLCSCIALCSIMHTMYLYTTLIELAGNCMSCINAHYSSTVFFSCTNDSVFGKRVLTYWEI